MGTCPVCERKNADLRVVKMEKPSNDHRVSSPFFEEVVVLRFANGLEEKRTFWSVCACKDCCGELHDRLQLWGMGEFVNHPVGHIPVVLENGREALLTDKQFNEFCRELPPYPDDEESYCFAD